MKRRIFTVLRVLGLCVGAASAQFGFGVVYDPTNYANAVLRYSQLIGATQPTPANLHANRAALQPGRTNGPQPSEHARTLPGAVLAVAECRRAQHLSKHRNVGQRHEYRPPEHSQHRLSAGDHPTAPISSNSIAAASPVPGE
jgi:hypothetical protein